MSRFKTVLWFSEDATNIHIRTHQWAPLLYWITWFLHRLNRHTSSTVLSLFLRFGSFKAPGSIYCFRKCLNRFKSETMILSCDWDISVMWLCFLHLQHKNVLLLSCEEINTSPKHCWFFFLKHNWTRKHVLLFETVLTDDGGMSELHRHVIKDTSNPSRVHSFLCWQTEVVSCPDLKGPLKPSEKKKS